MSTIIKSFLGFKDKINRNNPVDEKAKESFKINVKGQRVYENLDGSGLNNFNYDYLNKKDQGIPMLNMRTRLKVWGAMGGVFLYFYLCYKLIRYRLKADDLELMEREVNEEFKLKFKIEEMNRNNSINSGKN